MCPFGGVLGPSEQGASLFSIEQPRLMALCRLLNCTMSGKDASATCAWLRSYHAAAILPLPRIASAVACCHDACDISYRPAAMIGIVLECEQADEHPGRFKGQERFIRAFRTEDTFARACSKTLVMLEHSAENGSGSCPEKNIDMWQDVQLYQRKVCIKYSNTRYSAQYVKLTIADANLVMLELSGAPDSSATGS